MPGPKLEVFTSAAGRTADVDSVVIVRIGEAQAILTVGEWSQLLSSPRRVDIETSEVP